MPRPYAILLTACAAFLLGAAYWPGLSGGFFFDDWPSILLEEGVRLSSLTVDSLHQALISGRSGPLGRPVAQLSFALNHYFSGFDPFAFKVTNLAIHAACGLVIFGVVQQIAKELNPLSDKKHLIAASGCVTLFWLLHPIQLLPVLHVVQRMTSLSALFLAAALLLHIRGRSLGGGTRWAWLSVAWGVLWPLSVFSKETGALFPLFALAWELIVRRSRQGGLDRFARGLTVATGIATTAALIHALSPSGQWLWAGYTTRSFSLFERALTEGRVLWFYLSLILAPRFESFGIYHDDIEISTNLTTPLSTLPSLLGLVAIVWLTWRTRRLAPLVSVGLAWFLIGHSLESTILPLEIAHEHRNYLPSLGILLMVAPLLLNVFEQKPPYRTIGLTLTSVALIYCVFVTTLRAHQFGDPVRSTQIEAQHHRTSSRAQYQAGHALASLPEAADPSSPIHAFARSHFERSSELDPSAKLGLLGLIYLDCKAGPRVDHSAVDELARRLNETPLAPGDSTLLHSLKEMSIAGSLCLPRQDVDRLYSAMIGNPRATPWLQASLYSWHADYLWLHEHDLTAARNALAKSLEINPGDTKNRLKWAQLLVLSGELTQARELLLSMKQAALSPNDRKTLEALLLDHDVAR